MLRVMCYVNALSLYHYYQHCQVYLSTSTCLTFYFCYNHYTAQRASSSKRRWLSKTIYIPDSAMAETKPGKNGIIPMGGNCHGEGKPRGIRRHPDARLLHLDGGHPVLETWRRNQANLVKNWQLCSNLSGRAAGSKPQTSFSCPSAATFTRRSLAAPLGLLFFTKKIAVTSIDKFPVKE